MKKYIKWIILFIAIIAFGIIVHYLNKGTIMYFDNWIYSMISQTINPGLTQFLKVITNFGGPIGIICVLVLFSVFIKNKSYTKYIWLNVIIVFIMNQILKLSFFRARPDINRLVEESGFSFPSGHSMVSTALYGFLIYVIYKEVINEKSRNILILVLTMLVAVIGISRIYLGVHYASDVLAGMAVSVAYLVIYIKVVEKNFKIK